MRLGQVLLSRGRRLRPQDLGLLAAQGLDRLSVVKTPRAAVISTGDEIVPVNAMPGPGQIRDVNSYTLGALVESAHGRAVRYGLVNDDPEHLKTVVARAMEECDLVLISGGSSVGRRDYTVEVLGSFPGSEILVHGVSVFPWQTDDHGQYRFQKPVGASRSYGQRHDHLRSVHQAADQKIVRGITAVLVGAKKPWRFYPGMWLRSTAGRITSASVWKNRPTASSPIPFWANPD